MRMVFVLVSSYYDKIDHVSCRNYEYKKVSIGSVVGYLTVIEHVGKSKNGSKMYLCSCSCGGSIEVISSSLNSGLTQSCGCLYDKTKGIKRATHNMSSTPEYDIWSGMKARCSNPNRDYYHLYGGRGIKVCDRWTGSNGFFNFYEDMGYRPDGYLIDRIDCDGDYEPSNCRWVDASTSARNTRMKSSNKSGYVGVCFHKATGKWQASIRVDGKSLHLGVYDNIQSAVDARKKAEISFNYYSGV